MFRFWRVASKSCGACLAVSDPELGALMAQVIPTFNGVCGPPLSPCHRSSEVECSDTSVLMKEFTSSEDCSGQASVQKGERKERHV